MGARRAGRARALGVPLFPSPLLDHTHQHAPPLPLPLCPRSPRFAILNRKDPAAADELHHQLDDQIHLRHERLQKLAQDSKKPPSAGAAPPAPPAADKQ